MATVDLGLVVGSVDPLTIYPVGSIYMSVNSASPASLFGGTWEQLKDRFLLGAGDSYSAGSTGGEATHTLSIDEMPDHAHAIRFTRINSAAGTGSGNWCNGDAYKWGENEGYTDIYGPIQGRGSNQPHNNMPPYLAVYMWKRVS